MVLRRPYAFLIKHFRLIHLIITAILAYLVMENRDVYAYLNTVIADSVNRYNALSYINYGIYFLMFIALALCFVVYWLLKFKDKPRNIYIFTIVGYVIVGIFMFVLFSYMQGFSSNIIDQKTIRLYRDVLLMTLFFQYYVIIFMFIRGMGFDIKKFNFSKDAQELNLSADDSEEIEINTQIDTTNIVRSLRKQGREFGYFYKEYKVYIIIILVIVTLFSGYKVYDYLSKKFKVYSENEIIGNLNRITVKNSYFNITDNGNYVIVKFDIYKKGVKQQLNTGNMTLLIGKEKYSPDKNICYRFNYLGNCYKKQYVTNESVSYILTYSVDDLNVENTYLMYNESYDKSYKVKLVMKNAEE